MADKRTNALKDVTCLMHGDGAPCSQSGYGRYHCMLLRLNQMILDCSINHAECRRSRQGQDRSVIPTRLINVGSKDREAHLVRPPFSSDSGLTFSGPWGSSYAALSYCWGLDQNPTHALRERNEQEFMTRLPKLPKTIEEAIVICRKMGVQYLWIDALCIMQKTTGRSDEWASEVDRVGHYYSNSLFTIAAGWSASCEEGCLPVRKERLDYRQKYAYPEIMVGNDNIPLCRRAWVLQEATSSTRIIWFTPGSAYLFCKTDTRDYHNRLATQYDTVGPQQSLRDGRASALLQAYQPLPSVPQIGEDWYGMLQHYSRMKLTYEQDRIIALTGVTRFFNPDGKRVYVEGIWLDDVIRGLLWRSERTSKCAASEERSGWLSSLAGDESDLTNIPEYDARGVRMHPHDFCESRTRCKRQSHITRQEGVPTWSWASVNTRIQYNASSNKIRVRDERELLTNGDGSYNCRDANCPITSCRLLGYARANKEQVTSGSHPSQTYLHIAAPMSTLTFKPRKSSQPLAPHCFVDDFHTGLYLDLCSYHSMEADDGTLTLTCMLVTHSCSQEDGTIALLLLEKVDDPSGLSYKRLGMARIFDHTPALMRMVRSAGLPSPAFRKLLEDHFSADRVRDIKLV